MNCLSCKQPVASKRAKLWQKRLFLCGRCHAQAEKAERELEAAHQRARLHAMMWLEQRILAGLLLDPSSGMSLPGIGEPNPFYEGIVRAKELANGR